VLFKDWLKAEREKRAMTQTEFAVFVGLSRPMICDYENGVRTPFPASIRLIAGALKTPIKKVTEMIQKQKEGN
jgi:transcriptional regulator with XRE-family HTH domain